MNLALSAGVLLAPHLTSAQHQSNKRMNAEEMDAVSAEFGVSKVSLLIIFKIILCSKSLPFSTRGKFFEAKGRVSFSAIRDSMAVASEVSSLGCVLEHKMDNCGPEKSQATSLTSMTLFQFSFR